MELRFYVDASALAKRFVPEVGSPAMDYLFRQVLPDHMTCLALGTLEVISVFVRKKNAARISSATFARAMADFKSEVIDAGSFEKVAATNALIQASAPQLEKHGINATDAIVL